jgi:hypothetical protein
VRNIFELTRREQRAVVVIVVLLVAASLVKYWFEMRSAPAPVRAPSALPSASPQLSADQEQPGAITERP